MNIFNKISNWWNIKTRMYVHCNRETSAMHPSKILFEQIQKDHPDDESYYFLFSKDMTYITAPNGRRVPMSIKNYVFFVNPEWDKHGITDPKRVMTHELVHVDGLIGIHAYQPTVEEIATMYGIEDKIFDIKIERSMLNGEPYYILKRP